MMLMVRSAIIRRRRCLTGCWRKPTACIVGQWRNGTGIRSDDGKDNVLVRPGTDPKERETLKVVRGKRNLYESKIRRCVCTRAKEYHSHKIRTLMPAELSFISIVRAQERERTKDLGIAHFQFIQCFTAP